MIFRKSEVWMVQFSDPPEGGEQGYRSPAVIISNDYIDDLVLDVVIVVPSTTRRYINARTGNVPANLIEVSPSPGNGLTETSYFMCEQVRAVSKGVRMKKKLGRMSIQDLERIKQGLCLVMDLFP